MPTDPTLTLQNLKRERFAVRMLAVLLAVHGFMAILSFYQSVTLGARVGAGFLDLVGNSAAHFDTSIPYPGSYVKAAGLMDDALLYTVAVLLETIIASLLLSRLRLREELLAATANTRTPATTEIRELGEAR